MLQYISMHARHLVLMSVIGIGTLAMSSDASVKHVDELFELSQKSEPLRTKQLIQSLDSKDEEIRRTSIVYLSHSVDCLQSGALRAAIKKTDDLMFSMLLVPFFEHCSGELTPLKKLLEQRWNRLPTQMDPEYTYNYTQVLALLGVPSARETFKKLTRGLSGTKNEQAAFLQRYRYKCMRKFLPDLAPLLDDSSLLKKIRSDHKNAVRIKDFVTWSGQFDPLQSYIAEDLRVDPPVH